MPIWLKLLLIGLVGLSYWTSLVRLCASLHYNDFGKFYYGIASWRAGASMYALSPASYIGNLPDPLTNLNPPHGMLLVWPFALLPMDAAFTLWMLANGAGLVFATAIVARTIGWRPTFWQLVVLLLGAPMTGWLVTGQLSGLLAVPLALAWRDWRGGRAWSGGLWFGLVLAIKPFVAVFAAWLVWRRDWPALKGIGVGAAALTIAGASVFGVRAYADWLQATAAISWAWGAMNASILGIATRIFTVTPYHVPLVVMPSAVKPIWIAACISVLVVAIRRLPRASFDESWFLLMAGALLISPLGWVYYLWWVLPGLPLLLSSGLSVFLLFPLIVTGLLVFGAPSGGISLVFGSAYGWALLYAFLAARPKVVAPCGVELPSAIADGQLSH